MVNSPTELAETVVPVAGLFRPADEDVLASFRGII
jgi:hypothetical protein